ncbi:Helix-turn-helix domain-containing protein [Sphingomonas laterariae]|uniref:Helix-turn-helix domain-containing protein n=1 Tax=Edaphosphingomonas laterariae TaxID=861865 RepID=A0A239JL29_9SPHN|nr:Helix-turn-helix domain-containing protein [Sphingomonas laterariae]
MRWAASRHPPNPDDKLVLWALADACNGRGDTAWPSVAALSDFSGLNRKMIINSLARLVRAGLIADTGDRVGKTGQVKVWRLALKASPIGDR